MASRPHLKFRADTVTIIGLTSTAAGCPGRPLCSSLSTCQNARAERLDGFKGCPAKSRRLCHLPSPQPHLRRRALGSVNFCRFQLNLCPPPRSTATFQCNCPTSMKGRDRAIINQAFDALPHTSPGQPTPRHSRIQPFPRMGMWAKVSHRSLTNWDSPFPSAPTTIAVATL